MAVIVFLHGASSSGKSTIARAIRAGAERPFLILSFDTLRDGGAIGPGRNWPSRRAGIFDGLHRSFAAFADAGCDLVIEHILDTDGWHERLQALLCGHDLLFVGVTAPLATLEAREAARGDRIEGSARRDASRIHAGKRYDLLCDGERPAKANARLILDNLGAASTASGFFDTPAPARA